MISIVKYTKSGIKKLLLSFFAILALNFCFHNCPRLTFDKLFFLTCFHKFDVKWYLCLSNY